jgi:choline-sulfatase
MGSSGAVFMIRFRQYKYIRYLNHPEQLFDLESDPQELADLAGDKGYADVMKEGRERLRAILDPQQVDRRVKERQRQLLQANGGRDAVIARGDLGFSVPPGVTPMFD